ncbi:MAG: ABC transporter ATP-binding protein [Longimicrobiales bacterium]
MDHTLLLDSVTKRYSTTTAVDDLSLAVPAGSIYGILGPNGAGKSTTLRMVMNIITPDRGSISLLGADPRTDRTILRRVGYLPEERGLYRKMKVLDVIVFFAQLKGMDRKTARAEARTWLERMDLGKWAGSKVEALSKGMQQKVQFIATVLFQPDVLILDEPQSGLDPVNQEVLRDTILSARDQGRTVVLSTHNMSQAEAMCEFVCIIAGGRKIVDGRVRDIRREHRGAFFLLEFDAPSAQVDRYMQTSPQFRKRSRNGSRWEVELMPGVDARAVVLQAADLDVPLARFEHVEPSLHEIFVDHVTRVASAGRNGEGADA